MRAPDSQPSGHRGSEPGGDPQGLAPDPHSSPRPAPPPASSCPAPAQSSTEDCTGGLLHTCVGLQHRHRRYFRAQGLSESAAGVWSPLGGRMEPGAKASGLSSPEDESFSSVTRRSSLRWALKHSTPAGAALSWHSGLQGDVPSHQERGPAGRSPRPARSSWDLLSSPGGVSLMASFRKRRLSTIEASEVSSKQLGSNSDPFAFEEDPPVPASVTQQQQQGKSPPARRSPPNLGLPGIPDTARRRPRDLKRLAAVTERVRQWEIHLLQNIEEATQHELTIEDD
ncbi:coiled-coil domain-containing protein 201 [Bubalus bubalis]|uniref:coiled-coil domain-containing protein 201 n=1 Tax=Bubalus bubalis TaxID=89462 RepID=UPI001E1B632C|nr:coiled-coil domain-containing protein 201 [Bubalus bubalis]